MKYLKRSIEGIMVYDKQDIEVESSLKKYINELCLIHGSSFEGRVSSMKHILKRKGLVPVFVSHELLLVFTKSIRKWDVTALNYHSIISLKQSKDGHTVVVFDDCSEILLDVSYNRFKIQYEMANTINHILS